MNIVNVATKELEVSVASISFSFKVTGVRVWKVYGFGRLIPYEEWQTKPQGLTLLEVKEGQIQIQIPHEC